jgi:hypothetical protein
MQKLLIILLMLMPGWASAQFFFQNDAPQMMINHSLNSTDGYGSGVSFFDFNNDGWDDLTIVQENSFIEFYINQQGSYIPAGFSVFNAGETKQALWVDYDNDGDHDLFITTKYGVFRLMQNDGSFNFTDVTLNAGLLNNASTNYGASFGDINNDGWLDLYVCRYPDFFMTDPNNIDQVNMLFLNNGDGTFTDISFSSGTSDGIKASFQAVFLDFDKDGLQDIFVINDRPAFGNSLYRNNGDLTFTDVASSTGIELLGNNPMTATVGDPNNDGWLDIYMTNTGANLQGLLLINNQGVFSEMGVDYQVNIDKLSWGADFFDANNDGFQDLFVATSEVIDENHLYINQQGTSFWNGNGLFTSSNTAISFSVARGDFNNDGLFDLIVSNASPTSTYLWRNIESSGHRYVKISLQGTVSNRMAIGSWIYLYSDGMQQTRFIHCGENYLSQNSQHQIFGLGNSSQIDSVLVHYPSGIIERYYDLLPFEHYQFTEGETFTNSISYQGSLDLCEGDTLWLDAGDYESYLWSNGYQQRYLPVTQSGFYWVQVVHQQGISIISDTLWVNFYSVPLITYNTAGVSCFGAQDGTINLIIPPTINPMEINWNHGDTGAFVQNLDGGIYHFSYTGDYGCLFNDSVFVYEPNPIDIQYLVTPHSDSLSNLQWLINGGTPPYQSFINGEPANNPVVQLEAGDYSLVIIDANECSDSLFISVKGPEFLVNAHPNSEPFLYPNPFTGNFVMIENGLEITRLECYDVSGRLVSIKWTPTGVLFNRNESGLFILRITTRDSVYIKQLLKSSDH